MCRSVLFEPFPEEAEKVASKVNIFPLDHNRCSEDEIGEFQNIF
jgi:hypothetical protein